MLFLRCFSRLFLPPPPPRLSPYTTLFRSTRENVSVAPPGANATTSRTGFTGKACAAAPADAIAAVNTMAVRARSDCMALLLREMPLEEFDAQRKRPVRLGLAPGLAAVAGEGVVRAGGR